MQDPTWRDVFAYLLERIEHPHSPLFWLLLLTLAINIVSAAVGALWRRHVQHQRVAIVAAIVERWLRQLDRPLHSMPPEQQVAAFDRLGQHVLGHPPVVLQFLLTLRVVMESWQPDERVVAALDRLTQTWRDKLPSDRKRRERRTQALARRDVDRLVSRIARDGIRTGSPQ
jgi:hypothetical protein